MINETDIEAFREADETLTRCEERAKSGTVRHRHIMPKEELLLIQAGVMWREWAKVLGMELMAMKEAERQRGLMSMSPGEAEAKYGAV